MAVHLYLDDEIDLTEFLDFEIEDKYELENAILDNISRCDLVNKYIIDTVDDSWWIDHPEIDDLDACWEEFLILKERLRND